MTVYVVPPAFVPDVVCALPRWFGAGGGSSGARAYGIRAARGLGSGRSVARAAARRRLPEDAHRRAIEHVVGGRSEGREAFEQPPVLAVERARLVVRDDPERAHGLACDVKRGQQGFDQEGIDAGELPEVAVGVLEQQRRVTIEDGAARTVVARGRGVPN